MNLIATIRRLFNSQLAARSLQLIQFNSQLAARGSQLAAAAMTCVLAAGTAAAAEGDWPQWGGTNQRNMANTTVTGLPTTFDPGKFKAGTEEVDLATTKNIKWVAKLGSQTYGNPVIAGGRVYVGTNNESPRDPQHVGDRGVLMCLDEASGKLLWQLVVPKLESGKVNDWEYLGITASPTVEGDFVYAQLAPSLLQTGALLKEVYELIEKQRKDPDDGELRYNAALASPQSIRRTVTWTSAWRLAKRVTVARKAMWPVMCLPATTISPSEVKPAARASASPCSQARIWARMAARISAGVMDIGSLRRPGGWRWP